MRSWVDSGEDGFRSARGNADARSDRVGDTGTAASTYDEPATTNAWARPSVATSEYSSRAPSHADKIT